ncbi:MerR family DNA-binding transcriptional regulator [Euzebya sp.]|uniref:MerR family DNA-binding transcriptional regulator n=1 Tax=Euzebya sp. TaxID=1971409 RepID=UPI0035128FDD
MLIGELASATGVSAKTLRYWEGVELLPVPDRTTGGYRDYPREAVDRVLFVRRAKLAASPCARSQR